MRQHNSDHLIWFILQRGFSHQRAEPLTNIEYASLTSESCAYTGSHLHIMLNEYFSEMVPIIEKHEGVVLEYIGDAMMIVLGAPRNVERHQEKAVRCAMEMREHLKVLNQRWDEQELSRYWKNQNIDYLDSRAGIHTGNIVAGNIGADKVMKYGAIGDVVNIAA